MKLAILILLSAITVHAQNDQKGSLRGRFVDDLFQQGVTKARVTLTGNGLSNPLTADSDASGNFSLAALAPGNYSMAVEKAGFLRTDPRAIAIEPAGALNLGDITLVQSRRIRGKVRWPDGEPVNTASVQIMQLQAGKPVQGIGGYRTNDRGEYSMNEVRPGRYVVFASYSGWYNQTSSLSPRHALPVFYPAAPTPESASIVDVRTRAEAVDIDIVLQDRPGVTVEGIIEPTAKFPAGSEASLILIPDGIPSEFIASARMKAGETFKFTGIPEGRYLLINNSRELFRRAQPLTVGRSDIRDVRIPMPDGVPVEVKFEMEETVNGQTSRTPVAVSATSPLVPSLATRGRDNALGPYGTTSSRLDPQGRLTHTDVADGATYTLEFPRLPADNYVASVTQGGRTQTVSPFRFSTGAGAVTVVLRKDGGTVSGTAFTDNGSATPAFVVLAPKDRKNTLRFRTAATAKDGSFTVASIAPGEYDVFAFSRNDEDWYMDEDYLRRYAARAVAIEVRANGSATAQPKVIAVAP